MTVIQAILLGILQGFTEFLPVSSSGHLKLAEHFFHIKGGGTYFDVLLHVATLLAVLIYLWRDVADVLIGFTYPFVKQDPFRAKKKKKGLYLAWYIILASIPAGILGVLFGDYLENLANSPVFVGANLIFTGLILLTIPLIKRKNYVQLNWKNSFLVGVAQTLGILRGISRSGMTITAGLHLGLEPGEAGRFSFLIFIPAVTGAFLLELLKTHTTVAPIPAIAGFIAAFVSGLLALKLIFSLLSSGKLYWFGPYCIIVGGFLVIAHYVV